MDVMSTVGWLFVWMAPIALLYEVYLRWKATKAKSWPTTEGEIIHSEVESDYGHNSNRVTFRAGVKYKYKVKSRTYRSDNICVGKVKVWVNREWDAQQQCRQYPTGKTVKVFYNPDNPDESCLEPRVETTPGILTMSIAFFIIGVLAINGVFE